MKIKNFVRIVDGRLRTEPPVDAFASIQFELSRLMSGDLFIDTQASRQTLHAAIDKGAYAVLSTLSYVDEDTECAWIEVDSIETTLVRLLRYLINEKHLRLFLFSPIQASLFEYLHTPKQLKRLKGDLLFIARTILQAKEDDAFYMSDDGLAFKIAPDILRIQTALSPFVPVNAKGIFLSSFHYRERYLHEQKLPAHYVEECLSLLSFCDEHSLAYAVEQLTFCEHFYPQFVTPSLAKKEFGMSDRALIFEPDVSLVPKHLAYLAHCVDPSTTVLCLPEISDFTLPTDMFRTLRFKTYAKLKETLACMRFSYALISGDKESFEPFYTTAMTRQPTLF